VYVQNFVWSSDNSELLYSAKHGAVVEVFSLAIGSNEKPKYVASLGTRIARISSDQKGSIYALQAIRDTNIWKTTYDSGFQNQIAKEKLVSSPRTDESPSYSNDNRRISFLSDRSGADEIWIANADGSDPRQLSKFEGPLVVSGRWSPDDTKIGCHVSFGQDQDVYWLNTATGKPTKVTSGGKHLVGGWSADGKSLYYVKFEDARSKLYKTEIDSGTTVLVVDDATISFESPDGQFVYFAKASEPGVWRVPSSGGEPQVVGDASVFPGLNNGTFQADATGIYLIDDTAKPGSIIRYLDHSSGSINELARMPRMPGLYHYPSRDGRTWLSSQTDYTAAEIIKLALR
jgi:Tol biopolymer transport system component